MQDGKQLAVVFPGQGSQAIGMMEGFAAHPVVQATFAEASDVLGEDLWTLVAEGPAEALALTTNTQPLMLAAGVAVWRAWRASGGPLPAVVAGHSLGEYSALVAAGALEFRDALPLVRFRAQAMQDAVPPGVGAMAAIMGGDDEAVRAACAEAAQGQIVEPVNFNAPGQIVIAGHREAVERAIALAKQKGAKRGVLLPVSAPFHSYAAAAGRGAACRAARNRPGAAAVDPGAAQRRRGRARVAGRRFAMRWRARPRSRCAGPRPCGRSRAAASRSRRVRPRQGAGRLDTRIDDRLPPMR